MWKYRALWALRYALLLLSAGYMVWFGYVSPDFRADGLDTIVPLILIAIMATSYLVLFLSPSSMLARARERELQDRAGHPPQST
jgi:hypothetical protein